FNLRAWGQDELDAQAGTDLDGVARLGGARGIDGDHQFVTEDANGDGGPAAGIIVGDEFDGLGVDANLVEINMTRRAVGAIELTGPGLPDVFGLTQAHGEGYVA